MNKKIILLDLNSTLAYRADGFSTVHNYNRINEELYRVDLIRKIQSFMVIIITIRPICYKDETLLHLKKRTGFQPTLALFKNKEKGFAPDVKKCILFSSIFPQFSKNVNNYLALESNPMTRAMYKNVGIQSVRGDSPDLDKILEEFKCQDEIF